MGDVPSPSPSSTDDRSATGPSSEDHANANSFQGDAVVPNDGARAIVGKGMTSFSELINENIVAARYGTFATIALLTVRLIFSYCHIV